MKPALTLRIFYLALVMLLASATVYAGNQQKKPKHRNESLSCAVNAPAGKQAKTRSTHIRKKGKPAKVKKPAVQKPVKQEQARSPKPERQKKDNSFKSKGSSSFKSKDNSSRSRKKHTTKSAARAVF